ncbi:hypothetical protein [Paraburkholderia franconis]|nr:hypothetical protein [Paraburkholderia franconis]
MNHLYAMRVFVLVAETRNFRSAAIAVMAVLVAGSARAKQRRR